MRFLTSLFPDGTRAQAQWQRPLSALLASLSVHLLVLALLPAGPGSTGEASARSAASVVAVTLPGSASRGFLAVPPAPDYPPAAIEPVALDVTRGQRKTVAALPPVEPPDFALNFLPHTRYFSRSELTRPPVLQDEPRIDPPAEPPGETRPAGKVNLRVLVGASGAVDRVEVASSSLPPAYDAAAVAAFSRVSFRPGELDGVAVGCELRFEVAFEAGESAASSGPGMRAGGALEVEGGVLQVLPAGGVGERQGEPLPSASLPGQRESR